ncbi:GNAT family N-acetyltransferase [Mesorhizobium sp. AaZ16]|uniref:GNAT family N-acetyltransferase n=1 Tax=Mesorhizobium sp. AaZ16 TaxID=3402289 RepID=UPI00374F587F
MIQSDRQVVRLRRDLDDTLETPQCPDGFAMRIFRPSDAEAHHALLTLTFDDGDDGPFETWWPKLSGNVEYDPELIFLVFDQDERLIGLAQCFSSAFLRDLAVHPDMRGRGLGEALLHHVFLAFRDRGAAHVDLKTEADNLGAIRLYERVGMRQVPLEG